MQSLLGLKFLNSKSKHKELPQLQEKAEERASVSGYGKQKVAEKRNSEEGVIERSKKALVYASPSDPLETITELSEERDLDRRTFAEDVLGAPNKKKTPSSHSKVTKGRLPSAQAPVTRKNFAAVKNILQDETFTNNESIPAMGNAYKHFKRLYPEYLDTLIVDEIRAREYSYLDESGHVCLDYSGYGLFSKWQETWHKASASFGLSYISMNLPTHALYGGADEGTAEHDIKQMVLEFLNIQESDYAMVFTASRGSAFKLLGESYPFHLNKKLLSVYDYESDAITRLEEAAQKKGAEIMSARFRWPSQRLWATDLKKKLLEKKKNKREPGKGLFVFPVQSRVTGAKYSYQWMSQAQENGWDILLDASALGPNSMGSLGLCVFSPDFIVSSFFKVYGSDPTGFGCLLIKRSAIQRLHSSSAARGVGMVRLVSTTSLPERSLKAGDIREVEIVTAGSSRFTERQICSSCTLLGLSERACMAGSCPSTSKMLLPTFGKQGRIGHGQISTSFSSSPSKRHGVRGHEASSANSRILENNSPAYSLPFRKTEHGQVCTSSSTSPPKRHGVRGHETLSPNLKMPANESPAYSQSGRIGHSQVSTSSSTSSSKQHGVRWHEASSSNLRMPVNDSPAYSASSEPQQKRLIVLDGRKDIHYLQETELRLGYDFPQRLDAEEEDEMSSSESRSSTGFDSSRRNEGHLSRFLHQSQPSYASSSAIISDGQLDDPSLAYSEDISSAFFFDDDGYEDGSIPSIAEEDEDNGNTFFIERKEPEIECRGLHHAHKLGLSRTNIRLRCLINWLIASMLKLWHPGSPTSHRLVQIYGPKVNYDRGASVAFNLTDWKGNLLQPLLVQRLADRNNISLGATTLNHIHVPKSSSKRPSYLEHMNSKSVSGGGHTGEARIEDKSASVDVLTVAICFLSNFEDVYRFWLFLANFLDADFVSKEVWRYRSLNQATIMLGVEEPRKS